MSKKTMYIIGAIIIVGILIWGYKYKGWFGGVIPVMGAGQDNERVKGGVCLGCCYTGKSTPTDNGIRNGTIINGVAVCPDGTYFVGNKGAGIPKMSL